MEPMETRLFRLKSNAELQRIIASYCGYLGGAQFRSILCLFSNEQEDVRVETPWGVYEGYESLGRLYCGLLGRLFCGRTGEFLPGVFDAPGANTPVIAVAEDGRTARGLWVSPGMLTLPDPEGPNGLRSCWRWMKLGADFIYENDSWKLWHIHYFPLFVTPFEQSWTEKNDLFSSPLIRDCPPDRAGDPGALPIPPEPYSTFRPELAY